MDEQASGECGLLTAVTDAHLLDVAVSELADTTVSRRDTRPLYSARVATLKMSVAASFSMGV